MTDGASAGVYLDSMVFIYAVEEDATHGDAARKLLDHLQDRPGASVTSELSLAEVLAPTRRRGEIPEKLRAAYLELLINAGAIRLEPVSRSVLLGTSDLRLASYLKLPDAIHLATAIRSNCSYFVTNDAGIRVPEGMTKLPPDDTTVAEMIRAFP